VKIVENDQNKQLSKDGQRIQEALTSGEFTAGGRMRKIFQRIPSEQRCTICNAPFEGLGGSLMKVAFNKYPSNYSPKVCNTCFDVIRNEQIGAETEVSFLFADVRGSTSLAEEMNSVEFSQLINRFYKASTHVLIQSDAIIDKLIGDEVAAFYLPSFVGIDHALKSINAAKELLKVTGHDDQDGPWIPVGVGVHTGVAWIGAVGSSEQVTDITALGDSVNVAARLASMAGTGEILISDEAFNQAGLPRLGLSERLLELKGKSEPTRVWSTREENPLNQTIIK
jgi:adenylate cyclase